MNDLDKLYPLAQQRRISLLRVSVKEDELTSGSVLRRFPTGVSLLHNARSMEDARRIMQAYLDAAGRARETDSTYATKTNHSPCVPACRPDGARRRFS